MWPQDQVRKGDPRKQRRKPPQGVHTRRWGWLPCWTRAGHVSPPGRRVGAAGTWRAVGRKAGCPARCRPVPPAASLGSREARARLGTTCLGSHFILHTNAFFFLLSFNSHWIFQECSHHGKRGKVVLCVTWTGTKSWSPFRKITSPTASLSLMRESPAGHTCGDLHLWLSPSPGELLNRQASASSFMSLGRSGAPTNGFMANCLPFNPPYVTVRAPCSCFQIRLLR